MNSDDLHLEHKRSRKVFETRTVSNKPLDKPAFISSASSSHLPTSFHPIDGPTSYRNTVSSGYVRTEVDDRTGSTVGVWNVNADETYVYPDHQGYDNATTFSPPSTDTVVATSASNLSSEVYRNEDIVAGSVKIVKDAVRHDISFGQKLHFKPNLDGADDGTPTGTRQSINTVLSKSTVSTVIHRGARQWTSSDCDATTSFTYSEPDFEGHLPVHQDDGTQTAQWGVELVDDSMTSWGGDLAGVGTQFDEAEEDL